METDVQDIHDVDKWIQATFPYMKYFITKSGYNTKQGPVKIVEDIPDNYLDYLVVDINQDRVEHLKSTNCDNFWLLDITVPNYELEISITYTIKISNELNEKLKDLVYSHFDVNIIPAKTKPKFKVIKGGKHE